MEKRRKKALRKIIYILDALIVVLSLLFAFMLQNVLRDVLPLLKSTPHVSEYVLVAVFTLPLWLGLMPVFRLQQVFERLWTPTQIAAQLVKHHLTGLIVLTVVLFLTQTVVNRSLVALFLVCTFSLMFIERIILGFRLRYVWRHGHARPRIILAGAPGKAMAEFVKHVSSESLAPQFVGWISAPGDEPETEDAFQGVPPLVGKIDDLGRVLHDVPADQVLFFPPFNKPTEMARALNLCENLGIPARFAIDLSQPGLAVPRVISLHEHPFITFDMAFKPIELRALKHGFDTIAATLGLVLLVPLFVIISLAILVTMGRPILFIQERAGLYGRKFRMLKFRTMTKTAERMRDELLGDNEMSGPVFKIANDPRITRLGRFLRRSSIDELPQLINVLRGTMSLVGPRPLPIEEQQNIYGWHRRRLSVKPGITGLWQVSGRSDINFENWMKLDLQYVDEWSLSLDTVILLKTIRAVITKSGAR
ncbi:MAG: sugar transferase [Proteobacteria bacterium]|nr:sugar transferase [Pseudomonadota bacterium]